MGFTKKYFDMKKFVRAVIKQPAVSKLPSERDVLTPEDLNPCLFDVYIQILRNESIDISRLDFCKISDGDIDDLENVLDNAATNGLFQLSDVFRQFKPSATTGRVFI